MTIAKAFAVVDPNYTDAAIIAAGTFLKFNSRIPLVIFAETGGNYRRLRLALERYGNRTEIREVNFPDMPIFDDVKNQYTEMFFTREQMPAFAMRIKALAEMRTEAEVIVNIDMDTLTLNHITPAIEAAAENNLIAAVSERANRDNWLRGLHLADFAEMPDYYNTGFAAYPAGLLTDDLLREYAAFLRAYREKLFCPEQDFLNWKYTGMIFRMPPAYNLMFTDPAYTITAPRIIHYIGRAKPWTAAPGRIASKCGHYFPRYAAETTRWAEYLTPDFLRITAASAARV